MRRCCLCAALSCADCAACVDFAVCVCAACLYLLRVFAKIITLDMIEYTAEYARTYITAAIWIHTHTYLHTYIERYQLLDIGPLAAPVPSKCPRLLLVLLLLRRLRVRVQLYIVFCALSQWAIPVSLHV